MCKPLHAGTASEHGLRAARLAAKGFTARSDSLECDQGFASSQSDHLNADAALGEPPAGWHLRNNLFKYHAACYLTHAPIECAKEIRQKNNFPPERVKKILLRIDSGSDKVCTFSIDVPDSSAVVGDAKASVTVKDSAGKKVATASKTFTVNNK